MLAFRSPRPLLAVTDGYFRNRDLVQSEFRMAAEIIFLRTYAKLWTAAVAACLATLVLAALILPQSFRLTALSDLIQCLLLFSGTVVLHPSCGALARALAFVLGAPRHRHWPSGLPTSSCGSISNSGCVPMFRICAPVTSSSFCTSYR